MFKLKRKIITEFYYKVALNLNDYKIETSLLVQFIRQITKYGLGGIALSIIPLFLILLIEQLAKQLLAYLLIFPNNSIYYLIAEKIIYLNNLIGIKNFDYLSIVSSIAAGVIGVILGLFYTAFLTIIATKYSNVHINISYKLIEQKTINKYFILLSTVTSLAFLFQLVLTTGYQPTIISSIIFAAIIVATITTFFRYGKYALMYFDVGFLVEDLINTNNQVIRKIILHKNKIDALGQGQAYLRRIYLNIKNILLIVQESKRPETRNISLDSISANLLEFAKYFNSIKHTIPSSEGWHFQITKYKGWEDAQDWDYSALRSTGADIMPTNSISYNQIERMIIEIQFELFESYITNTDKLAILFGQGQFLQVTAIQCDYEILQFYVEKLEGFVIQKVKEANKGDIKFRLNIIQTYLHLIISYLVGFNYNLKIFSAKNIDDIARSISETKDPSSITQFPYFLRIWLDKYQIRLQNEKKINERVITPKFYTEYELLAQISYELKDHLTKAISYLQSQISKLSETLVLAELQIEALMLNMDSIEINKKFEFFSYTLKEKIDSLNELNYQKDALFVFKDLQDTIDNNKFFYNKLIDNIWELGMFSFNISKKDIPDLYGKYYILIINDITDKLLLNPKESIDPINYLNKFNVACIQYLEKMRIKYSDINNLEYSISKIYPFIIDLLDINSIALIVNRIITRNMNDDKIFELWNKWVDNNVPEIEFWKWIIAVYNFGKMNVGIKFQSYQKKHFRSTKFESYLINNYLVVSTTGTIGLGKSLVEKYKSNVNDIHVQTIARSMHMGSISFIELDEIFVEIYLRTRISIKTLNIKETRYGEQLRRTLENKGN